MSWKPEVKVDREWAGNALVFETKEESDMYGRDLLNRWLVPTDSRSIEVDEPPNYRIVDDVFTLIPHEEHTNGWVRGCAECAAQEKLATERMG